MSEATHYLRDLYRLTPEKEQIHVGVEVVRSAKCEKHGKRTSAFEGVLPSGWLFQCKGKTKEGRHTFIAASASGEPMRRSRAKKVEA